MDAQPAPWDIRRRSTTYAALYGRLALHPWRGPIPEYDAYMLFYARSLAMGWLTEAREGAVGGFWGTEEAEVTPNAGLPPSRVAWVQVGLTNLMPDSRLLPVQPFLACIGEVVGRMGTLDLHAVQVVLPVERLRASAGAASPWDVALVLVQDTKWFADVPPHARVRVQVTLNGGPNPAIRSAAPEMFRWMQSINQEIFVCASFSVSDEEALVSEAAFIGEFAQDQFPAWWQSGPHQATFRGTLVEWSLDAIGWLAAFLAEASHQSGVSTPLMLTVGRLDGSGSSAD
ncbi:MAG TPA: hypothetical protein VFS96_01775 [Nitrolancea sp.]|nr:hypothetical protein [Nitrolancea sp.]